MGQNPLISSGLNISICWQNRIYGAPGLLVVNIIVNYLCTRVLLYAKMLKETENEEARLFCHIFLIAGILIKEEPGPLGPSLAMLMIVTSMLFCNIKILCAFLFGCPCVHTACQSDTNGSILYDHAKYVVFLVEVKIALNSSSNLKQGHREGGTMTPGPMGFKPLASAGPAEGPSQ